MMHSRIKKSKLKNEMHITGTRENIIIISFPTFTFLVAAKKERKSTRISSSFFPGVSTFVYEWTLVGVAPDTIHYCRIETPNKTNPIFQKSTFSSSRTMSDVNDDSSFMINIFLNYVCPTMGCIMASVMFAGTLRTRFC
jgi:hypothetical protein